jgi:hypothetical protein
MFLTGFLVGVVATFVGSTLFSLLMVASIKPDLLD